MKSLVAYYSRAGENYFSGKVISVETGNTEKVALSLASFTGSDIFRIEQKNPYSASYEKCKKEARRDLALDARPELVSLPESIDGYDMIYLGYPIFWGTLPMAVLTFLESFDFTGKTITPFCTNEGSGLGDSILDIRAAANGARVQNSLAIHGTSVEHAHQWFEMWLRPKKG